MDKISVGTSQNVAIEYEIASVGDRIVAVLYDLLALVVYGIGAGVAGGLISAIYPGIGQVIMFLMILPVMFYDLVFETFKNGQSYGKRRQGIKVLRIDGGQPSFGNYLMRWLFRIIEVVPYGLIAIITIVLNGKGQRLGDIAAGTTVIKIRKKQKINLIDPGTLDQHYVPVFSQAAELNDQDIAIVSEVLSSDVENHDLIMDKLALKLKSKLNVETKLTNKDFLLTLLKDFNSIHGKM